MFIPLYASATINQNLKRLAFFIDRLQALVGEYLMIDLKHKLDSSLPYRSADITLDLEYTDLPDKLIKKSGYQHDVCYTLNWRQSGVPFRVRLEPWASKELLFEAVTSPFTMEPKQSGNIENYAYFMSHFSSMSPSLFYTRYKNKETKTKRGVINAKGDHDTVALPTFQPTYQVRMSLKEFFISPYADQMTRSDAFSLMVLVMAGCADQGTLAGLHDDRLAEYFPTVDFTLRQIEPAGTAPTLPTFQSGQFPKQLTVYHQNLLNSQSKDGLSCPVYRVWEEVTSREWVVTHAAFYQRNAGVRFIGKDSICDNCSNLLKCAEKDFQNSSYYATLLLPQETSVQQVS